MSILGGNVLYGRRYRIIVGIGAAGTGIDVSKLYCSFSVEKSMNDTPNYSEAVIYNLSPQTENTIIECGDRIVIEAGYEGNQYGLIFDGSIVQPLRDKEDGTTYKLTLVAQDGDVFLNEGIINKSLAAGQTPHDIVNELVNGSSEKMEIRTLSENLEDKRLARGKVVFGLSKDYLRQVSKSEDALFYVNDMKVEIIRPNDAPQGRILTLNAQTGLVGVPEQHDNGIKGRCLLNPFINLNTFVHVDNSIVRMAKTQRGGEIKQLDQDGVYRIVQLNHKGSTRGNDWYTDFIGVSRFAELTNA